MRGLLLLWSIICSTASGTQSASMDATHDTTDRFTITIGTIDDTLAAAVQQYQGMIQHRLPPTPPWLYPRTVAKQEVKLVKPSDWCSGFFPGTLWQLYEATKDPAMLAAAEAFTDGLYGQKNNHDTHDVGFILYSSFGQGLRLIHNATYSKALWDGAQSLATRFNDKVGCLQSWPARNGWTFPVIIDNLMNLELLFWASKQHVPESSGGSSGGSSGSGSGSNSHSNSNGNDNGNGNGDRGIVSPQRLKEIALSHLDTTLAHHFRPDGSSFHVVDYDPSSGAVRRRQTHQGLSDASAWARGQSWALYGYTVAYRETADARYLAQAERVAQYLVTHPHMPADKVPYWDYDAAPATATATATDAATTEPTTSGTNRATTAATRAATATARAATTSAASEAGPQQDRRSAKRVSKHAERSSSQPQPPLQSTTAGTTAATTTATSERGTGGSDPTVATAVSAAAADVPRDSSAAAIMSAALLELCTLLPTDADTDTPADSGTDTGTGADADTHTATTTASSTTIKHRGTRGSGSSGRRLQYADFALAQLASLTSPDLPYRTAYQPQNQDQPTEDAAADAAATPPHTHSSQPSLRPPSAPKAGNAANPEPPSTASSALGFLLQHATGHYPHHSEVDVPLAYADYYYVQALLRAKVYLQQQQ